MVPSHTYKINIVINYMRYATTASLKANNASYESPKTNLKIKTKSTRTTPFGTYGTIQIVITTPSPKPGDKAKVNSRNKYYARNFRPLGRLENIGDQKPRGKRKANLDQSIDFRWEWGVLFPKLLDLLRRFYRSLSLKGGSSIP